MWSPRPQVPSFSGPHTVGSTEYEIPISEIDTQTSPPDSRVNTLKFRLFYPTSGPYNGQTIPWVPAPQKQWTEAFGKFLGASLGWSSIVNPVLSLLTYITIPAIPNAPLSPQTQPYPLVIFSHGLAGNCNTYSSFCGSMASCGMVVAAIEHRDGSCPITMLRGADGHVASQVDYRKYSHNPTAEVFSARNAQLRTRMWELDLLYTTLGKLNAGEQLKNYASVSGSSKGPTLTSAMDFRPGRITWAGHSFGACTVTQFVKSVYYHKALPSLKGTEHENDPDWRPLLAPRLDSALIKQITPSSPLVLLDVWTMPFRAPSTQWLWERPLPCYTKKPSSQPAQGPTTISVMSTEFYNWTEMLNRTRILLSANPLAAAGEISRQSEPRSPKTPKLEDSVGPRTPKFATPPNKHPLDDDDDAAAASNDTDLLPPASLPLTSSAAAATAEPIDRSASASPSSIFSAEPSSTSSSSNRTTPADSPTSSTTSLSPSLTAKPAPTTQISTTTTTTTTQPTPNNSNRKPAALYHIPHSAHLSQSDFGPLFPTLTRLLMKAVDATGTMELNVRAACQAMRNAGIEGVEPVDSVAGAGAGKRGASTAVEEVMRRRRAEEERKRKEAGDSNSRGWLGWLRSGGVGTSEGAKADEMTAEDQAEIEREAEALRQDGILQEMVGLERWKELDVPLVGVGTVASC